MILHGLLYNHLCNTCSLALVELALLFTLLPCYSMSLNSWKCLRYIRNPDLKKAEKTEERVNIIMETVKKVRIETLGGL